MEQLLPEVMADVLLFLVLSDRVQLASCSKSLQQRVYRDCSKAWEEIIFQIEQWIGCPRLTDLQLSHFLIQVNARNVTKTLDLSYCRSIRGSGLIPLRNSRVLERIHLEGTGADENPTPALELLRSMIPHKLYVVNFALMREERNQAAIQEFLYSLRSKRLEQAQYSQCLACELPLTETTRQLVVRRKGNSLLRCCVCKKSYCKRPSCPMNLQECRSCFNSFCGECNLSRQCFGCGYTYCLCYCEWDRSCTECKKFYCKTCDADLVCEKCHDMLCQDCARREDGCNCVLCKRCYNGRCDICAIQQCINCNDIKVCASCDRRICRKTSCQVQATTCQVLACEKTFCTGCKEMEYCIMCKASFCKDHNRFVDCNLCKFRHCRPCGHKKMGCDLCGTACYEGCVCDGGKEPALKRGKLS